MLRLEFDVRLVEDVVLLAIERETEEERRRFRRERDALYGIGDPEDRERRFNALHGRWFSLLELAQPVQRLMAEAPLLERYARGSRVIAARDLKEQGADLYDPSPSGEDSKGKIRPLIVIRLLARTFLREDAISGLLRHELVHVSDMLDPDFGYERDLPSSVADPMLQNLVRARYRVLWDATIDGRLVATGKLSPDCRQTRMEEFIAAYPMLTDAEAPFARFFRPGTPRHHELLRFACNPASAARL